MSDRNLNHLIAETIAEHPIDTAHQIACTVAKLTDAEDLERFYITALEPLVADRIRLGRNAVLNDRKGQSAKLAERRDWWRRVLRERVHVGDHLYKALADCTVDDLTFCITERAQQIEQLRGQITKYETIRDAMLEHGAGTAAELPEGAVQL